MSFRSVLVVDDHPLMRDAICETLLLVDPQLKIRTAKRLSEALAQLAEDPSDLVTLDLSLPDTTGADGLVAVRSAHPDVPVVVCSGHVDARSVYRAIEAGAVGYVPKTFEHEGIEVALRVVLSGNVYLPPIEPVPRHGTAAMSFAAPTNRRIEDLELSPRQTDVLRLLIRGLPNKLICRELNIAEGTAKAHVSAVLSKLGARNRTEAVVAISRIDLGPLGLIGRSIRHDAPR